MIWFTFWSIQKRRYMEKNIFKEVKKMKKLLVALIMSAFLLVGCAGNIPQSNDLLDKGTDLAFYFAVKNNPQHKAEVINILEKIEDYATEDVTYNDIVLFAAKKFGDNQDLAAIALIVGDDLFLDEPIINNIGLFDGYREDLLKRIDRLIILAEMVE